jgi:expansin (peptidoglycan-binding protein)
VSRSIFLSVVAAAVPFVFAVVACGSDDSAGDGSSGGASSSSGSSGSSAGTSGSAGSSGSSGTTTLSSELKKGVATFYDYSGGSGVACSFDKDGNTDVTAIDTAEYAKSAACGSCLAVSGPTGQLTVRIVDECPDCDSNHLDLSAEAFAKIADPKDGRVPITYQLVACDVSGNLSYRFKEGSSQYWTAIQVRNHRVPIAKVEYKKAGVYTDMPRADYNYFIDTKGVGEQPSGIALRITAQDGQVVEDMVPGVAAGQVVGGSVQFK